MKTYTVALKEACDTLARAALADPLSVITLLGIRVPCNNRLAVDPTIQVADRFKEDPDLGATVSPLGLLNGLSNDPEVAISAEHDTDNRITFAIVNNQTGEVLYRPNNNEVNSNVSKSD